MASPIRPTTEEARRLAMDLIRDARFAALAVRAPDTGAPQVSRIGLAPAANGLPMSLISDLAHHTVALRADPLCSLLIGEPGPKGDPLTWPRLSLQAEARLIPQGAPERAALDAQYLRAYPKAKLYIGFADFSIVTFSPLSAHLNGGFGKAFVLSPDDLVT